MSAFVPLLPNSKIQTLTHTGIKDGTRWAKDDLSLPSPSGFIPKPNQTLSTVFSQHEIEHYNKKHMLNHFLTTFILAYWYDQEAQIWQLLI